MKRDDVIACAAFVLSEVAKLACAVALIAACWFVAVVAFGVAP